MTVRNRYANRSKISEHKFRQIIRYFAVDLDASQITKLVALNRNSVNRYLRAVRERIAEFCETQSPFSGEIEVDESFFGARRIKGKRGRGASGKTIVFGILKRNGKVYTEIVPDCSKATLQAVIRGRVTLDSVIYSDGWRGYNGLVDVGYGKHFRIDHGRNEFAKGSTHVNGIEGFWGFSKTRLSRFRGMRKSTFYLHLKECEFRFNYRDQDLYQLLIKMIKNQPLF
ncbi:MAG: IS1595 family transposase [Nitrospinae bacterium]|nr:IS1595 family transposase [Nitrospinota bacterium]MZH45858.1 IS1595 family transposase [Nitrospinota bacterium]